MTKKLLPLFLIGACGGKVGEAIRPNDPSAAQAMNESTAACLASSTAQPLVIDLSSAERTDLELAMRHGVMVVNYDCKSLKLVKGCELDGSYAFAAVVPKEDLVQIKNADELLANMPISGAKFEAEIKAGSSIDLVLVTIGQRGSTLLSASKSDLKGPECKSATHFVRAAYVGGFSMTKNTAGSAKAAAEGFGAKANAASGSDKLAAAHDGDLETCRASNADMAKPPDKCQSPLRIEIVPITAEKTVTTETEAPKPKPAPAAVSSAAKTSDPPVAGPPPPPVPDEKKCQAPLVWTGTMCAKQDNAPHQCKPSDEADCTAQCNAGHAASCTTLGYISFKDPKKAADAFDKGCKGRDPHGCFAHAGRLLQDRALSKDDAQKSQLLAAAQKDTDAACAFGDGWSCWNTAEWYRSGSTYPKDLSKSASLLKRSCDLGYGWGCLSLADAYISGSQGLAKDPVLATSLLSRACESGNAAHCERLGNAYLKGELGAKDGAKALDAFGKACSNGGARSCALAGQMLTKGDTVTADPAKAKDFYAKGCTDKIRGWDACLALGEILEKTDKAKAAEAYERGCMLGACGRAAAIWEKGDGVKADPDKALALYGRACNNAGDLNGCDKQGALLEKSDKTKASAFYLDVCTRLLDGPSCDSAKRLGATIPPTVKPRPRAPKAPPPKP